MLLKALFAWRAPVPRRDARLAGYVLAMLLVFMPWGADAQGIPRAAAVAAAQPLATEAGLRVL
ncbi:MAG: hypothetical protein AB1409_06405, partial [Pseudomonadota bacterium]